VFAEQMKFFDVPKLGCYFAIELTYQSCLDEKAFDLGLEDLIECGRLRAEQAEEIRKN